MALPRSRPPDRARAGGGPRDPGVRRCREATRDDLSTLLDLADSQISYRQRYLTGIARVPVLDLVALDPGNPRGIAFQVAAICGASRQAAGAVRRRPRRAAAGAGARARRRSRVTAHAARARRRRCSARSSSRLVQLSDAVARRYFLQGAEPLRAAGTDAGLMLYAHPPRDALRLCASRSASRAAICGSSRSSGRGRSSHDYDLTIEPHGRTSPARAEAGLANVMRLVVETPVRALTIDSTRAGRVDRPIPLPAAGDPDAGRGRRAGARQPRRVAGEPGHLSLPLAADPARPRDRRLVRRGSRSRRAARWKRRSRWRQRIQREFDFDPDGDAGRHAAARGVRTSAAASARISRRS